MSETVTDALTIGGRQRGFTIRLPREAPGDRPVPLVLMLHGNQSGGGLADRGGSTMREWTTFDEQADAWGVAVAYPDGFGGCWADGRGVTAADESGVDDVAFLRALIDWSAGRHGTAPDRTVVAGISNGAFMAHRLAAEASGQVAVLAAVAGGLPAALLDVRPDHAVSAMLVNGTADKLQPIEGGTPGAADPMENSAGARCRCGRRPSTGAPSTAARPARARRTPPNSPAARSPRAASAAPASSPGPSSAAGTAGRARSPRPSGASRPRRSSTRRRRSAASPCPCSPGRTPGVCDPVVNGNRAAAGVSCCR
jgi:predicted esterase